MFKASDIDLNDGTSYSYFLHVRNVSESRFRISPNYYKNVDNVAQHQVLQR